MWDPIADNPGNVARTFFEAGRLVPAVGLWSGLAADGVNAYQDITAAPETPGNWFAWALATRSLINAANNGVGAVLYLDQMIQDGLASSVVGVELVPITAVVNEIGATGKIAIDSVQFGTDSLIAMASYAGTLSATDAEQAAAWQSMLDGYQANVITDVFATANDIFGVVTAGASQSGAVDQGTKTFRQLAMTSSWAKPAAVAFLISLQNVWGSLLTTDAPAAPAARAVARQAEGASAADLAAGFAWEVAEAELRSMKACYEVGDLLLGEGAEVLARAVEDAERVATELLDGQEPFALIQQLTTELMSNMRGKLIALTELETLAGTADENTVVIRASLDELTALVASLQIPSVEIPDVDLGEGAFADAGELVLGAGADVANAGVEMVLEQVRAATEEGKAVLLEPLGGLRGEAEEMGRFIALMGEGARLQIVAIEDMLASLQARLEAAEDFPQAVEALINESLGIVGIDAEFSFEDVRDAWRDLGPAIDEAIAYAAARGLVGPVPDVAELSPLAAAAGQGEGEDDR